jgi:putative nucleotidyltransferase with HDIG domain
VELVKLFPEITQIDDSDVQDKTVKAWQLAIERGGWESEELLHIPFTLLIPETDVSLIDHTRAVTQCALSIGDCLAHSYTSLKINRDFLLSGGILHDVGKLLEYEKTDSGFRKSPRGILLRHPVSGANLASEVGLPTEIVHIIYTHSKEGETYQRSVESIIIHYSDFLNFETLRTIT